MTPSAARSTVTRRCDEAIVIAPLGDSTTVTTTSVVVVAPPRKPSLRPRLSPQVKTRRAATSRTARPRYVRSRDGTAVGGGADGRQTDCCLPSPRRRRRVTNPRTAARQSKVRSSSADADVEVEVGAAQPPAPPDAAWARGSLECVILACRRRPTASRACARARRGGRRRLLSRSRRARA